MFFPPMCFLILITPYFFCQVKCSLSNTNKLYYGFPIFILGYEDERFDYNITTCSSSYSLGKMLVFGLYKGSNAAHQIMKYKKCSINILNDNNLNIIEYAGYHNSINKLDNIPFSVLESSNIPYLDQSILSIILNVNKFEEFGDYINFTCDISRTLVSNEIMDNEHILINQIKPPVFVGDDKKRVYRYFDKSIGTMGSFLKNDSV